MAAQETHDTVVDRDQFLQQVVLHHRRGDYYPDPQVISDELRFTSAQTDAVLSDLRTLRWIADSPYGSERVRLTPRCWSVLLRESAVPNTVPALTGEDVCPAPWHVLDEQSPPLAVGQTDALATLMK